MTVLAVAHRAGNSLAGLQSARELGVDVVECDVHRHRGRLEVRHLKTAGPLPFLWDRWELAPAGAPRLGLDELLAADQRGSTFMLDLKGRRVATGRADLDEVVGQDWQNDYARFTTSLKHGLASIESAAARREALARMREVLESFKSHRERRKTRSR